MICFLFIPVHWLFFAASTYVWVQYVWHTGEFSEMSDDKLVASLISEQINLSIHNMPQQSPWCQMSQKCSELINQKAIFSFREGNMSANSVSLAALRLHRGGDSAEGIQIPFWHEEPSISSRSMSTLRSPLVSLALSIIVFVILLYMGKNWTVV